MVEHKGLSSESSVVSSPLPDIIDTTIRRRDTLFPNSAPIQSIDTRVLQRQTGQINPSKAAIGVPKICQCRHGFPQAFAMDPVPPNTDVGTTTNRMNSGLVKLTCPHLVRAVDTLEDEGLIQSWNNEKVEEWWDDIQSAHKVHADTRQSLLPSEEDRQSIASKLGERGLEAFMDAGVAAASRNSKDFKCLHAWLGDDLFRGPTPMGEAIREELHARGIDPTGTKKCNLACDPTIILTDNTLPPPSPPKPRNKQRLRTGKEIQRRKRRKHEMTKGAILHHEKIKQGG
jgi:hypothetical protein